jgi:diamine N-acetyltransferase
MTDRQEIKSGAVVSLRQVTAETVIQVCKLSDTLPAAQQKMVAPNAVSIAEAHFNDKAWFRAIYAGETLVGFIMLYDDPQESEYFLWRLMIAAPYQGMGFGKRALELLVEYVRSRPGARALYTSYVPVVDGQEGFYRKLGFEPTGEIDDGELVSKLNL